MARIDAHIHLAGDHPDVAALLEELDVKVVNISVSRDADGQWRRHTALYQHLSLTWPERFAWCTSFDLPGWEDPNYARRVIAQLDADFAAGAVACKVWKNIGMELRHPAGHFFMVDDPLLEPIFAHLEANGRTVMMHVAEPLACWQPLDENNLHYGYYRSSPEWHMYGRAGFPSHADILAARDRLLARHPKLRVIGAHLGSMEHDVAEIDARMRRHDCFAVDTSARILNLAMQDRDAVREFFIRRQDRILFGTDVVIFEPISGMDAEQRAKLLANLHRQFEHNFTFFGTDETFTYRNRQIRGLDLPQDVLEKLYRTNAQHWMPGV